jgi:hypothetical protein
MYDFILNYFLLLKKWLICLYKKIKLYNQHFILLVFISSSMSETQVFLIENISGRICRGRIRVVVGFTTTCAISAYHH